MPTADDWIEGRIGSQFTSARTQIEAELLDFINKKESHHS